MTIAISRTSTSISRQSEIATGFPPSSLIICTRNRSALLGEAIESILAGRYVPDELIIIDQSDTRDEKLTHLSTERNCKIHYQWMQPLGLSQARNFGIEAAQNDWLVFTDDDVLVERDWFGILLQALAAEGPRSVVTGRVLALYEPDRQGFVPSTKEDENPAIFTGRVGQDVLYSNNMAFHKSAVADIGGFDERLGPGTHFPSAEDNDLGYRLLENGYQIVYAPLAVVSHRAWRKKRDFLRLRRNYGIGRGRVLCQTYALAGSIHAETFG